MVKMNQVKTVEVEARILRVFIKACDQGSYDLLDQDGSLIASLEEEYVPSNMGIGGGDYLEFAIDLDNGRILDWEVPTRDALEEAFYGDPL